MVPVNACRGRGRAGPRRGRAVDRRAGDEGSTLIEVVVGMTIMSVFLAAFTGAIVTLNTTQNRAQALTASAGDLNTAFQRLDSSVRYASAISAPGTTGPAGAWYVEFLTTATGASVCTQLSVSTGANPVLRSRTWTPTGTTATGLTAFVPLTSHITNGGAVVGAAASSAAPVPFVLTASGTGVGYEQLTVQLVATTGNPAVTSRSAATFTAVNSAAAYTAAGASPSSLTTVCNQVARS